MATMYGVRVTTSIFMAQSVELVHLSHLGLDVSSLSSVLDESATLLHGIPV